MFVHVHVLSCIKTLLMFLKTNMETYILPTLGNRLQTTNQKPNINWYFSRQKKCSFLYAHLTSVFLWMISICICSSDQVKHKENMKLRTDGMCLGLGVGVFWDPNVYRSVITQFCHFTLCMHMSFELLDTFLFKLSSLHTCLNMTVPKVSFSIFCLCSGHWSSLLGTKVSFGVFSFLFSMHACMCVCVQECVCCMESRPFCSVPAAQIAYTRKNHTEAVFI